METNSLSARQVGSAWRVGCVEVLGSVLNERDRQVSQYGLNRDIEDGTGPGTAWLAPVSSTPASALESLFRAEYEAHEASHGAPTWMHLVREEVAEAFQETDPQRLQAELLQVAALCVSWVENIRHRQAQPPQENHE